MTELSLWFTKSESEPCELERTLFKGPGVDEVMAVRGKTAGAYKGAGTFQWTPGVKALAVVFLIASARQRKGTKTFLPLLEGERGSLASSLDYALNKQPEWLFDMFGSDEKSNSYLRQLLLRSNTGRRRSGPVSISLHEQLLSPQSIKVYVGDVLIQEADTLQRMAVSIINSEKNQLVEEQEIDGNGFSSNGEINKLSDHLSNTFIGNSYQGQFPIITNISEEDINDIFEFEREHFPSSHANKERLKEWLRHDPNNYVCIKEPGQSFLAYYLLMFLEPQAMQDYLAGDLTEVEIAPKHLLAPSDEIYAQQDNLHICVFASRTHATMFTVDLLWHLIGRLLDLAINGRLHTIYAEIATNDGKTLVERFGFQQIRQTSSGGLLFKLQPSLAMVREWEWRYQHRTFCKAPLSKLQTASL